MATVSHQDLKHRLRSSFPLLAGSAILILITGCDIFTTRTAEEPDGGSSGGWNFPATPAIAIENLKSSIGRRSSADYLRLFVPANSSLPVYQFLADPTTSAGNPARFETWSLGEEQKHCQALFAPATLPLDSLVDISLTLERESIVADTAQYDFAYDLHLGHLREDVSRDVRGRATFTIIRDRDGGWYLQTWSDLRNVGSSCWSDIKAAF